MKITENYIQISEEFFLTKEWNRRRTFSEGEALLFLIAKKEIRISARNLGIIFGWSKAKVILFIHKLITKGYIKRRIEEKVNVLTIVKFLKIDKEKIRAVNNNSSDKNNKKIDIYKKIIRN